MLFCSHAGKANYYQPPSRITASLRRTNLSARLAVVYFALPGCGFAILILDIVFVCQTDLAGVF